jgi:hypothetical protein
VPVIDNQPMGRALASIFNTLPVSISNFQELDDPLVVVPALLQNLGGQIIQQLAGRRAGRAAARFSFPTARVALASSADYTALFMPAYAYREANNNASQSHLAAG